MPVLKLPISRVSQLVGQVVLVPLLPRQGIWDLIPLLGVSLLEIRVQLVGQVVLVLQLPML